MFEALLEYLDELDFKSRPSYDSFRKTFQLIMNENKFNVEDPFDWEVFPLKNSNVSFLVLLLFYVVGNRLNHVGSFDAV
jgi:hypothetical protein